MIGKQFTNLNRGVSPVVGVILMVAVTVILAAVIGSVVLDLGSGISEPAQAGVSFDEQSGDVDVQLTTVQNADSITVQTSGSGTVENGPGDGTQLLTESAGGVGSVVEVNGATGGDTISVIGEVDGESSVIQTYEVQG